MGNNQGGKQNIEGRIWMNIKKKKIKNLLQKENNQKVQDAM